MKINKYFEWNSNNMGRHLPIQKDDLSKAIIALYVLALELRIAGVGSYLDKNYADDLPQVRNCFNTYSFQEGLDWLASLDLAYGMPIHVDSDARFDYIMNSPEVQERLGELDQKNVTLIPKLETLRDELVKKKLAEPPNWDQRSLCPINLKLTKMNEYYDWIHENLGHLSIQRDELSKSITALHLLAVELSVEGAEIYLHRPCIDHIPQVRSCFEEYAFHEGLDWLTALQIAYGMPFHSDAGSRVAHIAAAPEIRGRLSKFDGEKISLLNELTLNIDTLLDSLTERKLAELSNQSVHVNTNKK